MTMNSFDNDKSYTVKNSKFAADVLKYVFNGAVVFSWEKDNQKNSPVIIRVLDRVGIDLTMFHEGTVTGISSRCFRKISKRGYTVTIREFRKEKPAEVHFLRKGLKRKGTLIADLNIQTYVDSSGKSAVVILMKNADLIRYLDSQKNEDIRRFTDKDGVTFISVRWLDLLNAGVDFQLFKVDSRSVTELDKFSFLQNKKIRTTAD